MCDGRGKRVIFCKKLTTGTVISLNQSEWCDKITTAGCSILLYRSLIILQHKLPGKPKSELYLETCYYQQNFCSFDNKSEVCQLALKPLLYKNQKCTSKTIIHGTPSLDRMLSHISCPVAAGSFPATLSVVPVSQLFRFHRHPPYNAKAFFTTEKAHSRKRRCRPPPNEKKPA